MPEKIIIRYRIKKDNGLYLVKETRYDSIDDIAKILKEGKIKYSGISSISGLRITEKKRLEEFLK
jgi:hypothetical protein